MKLGGITFSQGGGCRQGGGEIRGEHSKERCTSQRKQGVGCLAKWDPEGSTTIKGKNDTSEGNTVSEVERHFEWVEHNLTKRNVSFEGPNSWGRIRSVRETRRNLGSSSPLLGSSA